MTEGTDAGANATSVTLGTPATADTLTSPVNDGFDRIDPAVDNISDIDTPVKAEPTKTAAPKVDANQAAEAKAAAEKADLERFDRHPRFQELRAERDAMKYELNQIKESLKSLTPQQQQVAVAREEQALPYKDITKMAKAEILEWQEDDPVGYAANLYQQMLHEARETLRTEQTETQTAAQREQTVRDQYMNYQKAHPDFMKLWQAGHIQKVMESNPVMFPNAIAAHMAMTLHRYTKTEKQRVDEAVAKAVKEVEDRVTKNFQAKKNAEVITEGGTVKATEGTPDELKHPDKYGGATQALASRLSRMRQAATGG